MNKSVLIGSVAFGGLLLATSLVLNKPEEGVVSNEVVKKTELTIPGDFVNFPMYPNSNVRSVRESEGENSRDVSVSLSTNDTISEINEWYRGALSGGGWNIKSDKNVAGYQIIQGESNNLYTSMQAAVGDGEVVISQSLKIRK